MRTRGSYEYGADHEELLHRIIDSIPKTTNAITKEFRKIFSKVAYNTVERLLNNLYEGGKIKKFRSGRISLWQK